MLYVNIFRQRSFDKDYVRWAAYYSEKGAQDGVMRIKGRSDCSYEFVKTILVPNNFHFSDETITNRFKGVQSTNYGSINYY